MGEARKTMGHFKIKSLGGGGKLSELGGCFPPPLPVDRTLFDHEGLLTTIGEISFFNENQA